VTNRRSESPGVEDEENWIPIDGSEQILFGPKLTILTEGASVRIAGRTDSMKMESPTKAKATDAE
jgi:hypothetical protein